LKEWQYSKWLKIQIINTRCTLFPFVMVYTVGYIIGLRRVSRIIYICPQYQFTIISGGPKNSVHTSTKKKMYRLSDDESCACDSMMYKKSDHNSIWRHNISLKHYILSSHNMHLTIVAFWIFQILTVFSPETYSSKIHPTRFDRQPKVNHFQRETRVLMV
jgi:hypothetical protein